jgi:RimJ/RimL family protein N-acetyltransferase
MNLEPCVLSGDVVRLEPLSEGHLGELARVALAAPSVWTHIALPMRNATEVAATLDIALSLQRAGQSITFVTRLVQTGDVVGSSSIFLVDRLVPSVEIGATWIVPAWQRTAVNSEAKLLMLAFCFEQLGCARVELKTDVRNTRSQAAIARLGATREGVLRAHKRRVDGTLRDSVLYSLIASEWPERRERLAHGAATGTPPKAV